jgi:molybdopterin-binding protein
VLYIQIFARNSFSGAGKDKEVKLGTVMADIVVHAGNTEIVAVITKVRGT